MVLYLVLSALPHWWKLRHFVSRSKTEKSWYINLINLQLTLPSVAYIWINGLLLNPFIICCWKLHLHFLHLEMQLHIHSLPLYFSVQISKHFTKQRHLLEGETEYKVELIHMHSQHRQSIPEAMTPHPFPRHLNTLCVVGQTKN